MKIAESTNYIRSFDEEFPAPINPALTLILARALADRVDSGKSSPEQINHLLDLGYSPDLVLSLTWAQANETIRLLTADTVRTTEEPS